MPTIIILLLVEKLWENLIIIYIYVYIIYNRCTRFNFNVRIQLQSEKSNVSSPLRDVDEYKT